MAKDPVAQVKDKQKQQKTNSGVRKKAAYYDEQRITLIVKKFAHQPIDLLPPEYRPEVLSKTCIIHLSYIIKRCDSADTVTCSLHTAVTHRPRNLTLSPYRAKCVAEDDLIDVLSAMDHYLRVKKASSIGEGFKVPTPVDNYLDDTTTNRDTLARYRNARLAKFQAKSLFEINPAKPKAKRTKATATADAPPKANTSATRKKSKDDDYDPSFSLSEYGVFHG